MRGYSYEELHADYGDCVMSMEEIESLEGKMKICFDEDIEYIPYIEPPELEPEDEPEQEEEKEEKKEDPDEEKIDYNKEYVAPPPGTRRVRRKVAIRPMSRQKELDKKNAEQAKLAAALASTALDDSD
eukprot:TRINITY_DN67715_c3_g4_i1.p1 TRINITY_DN67715_c3_g4~~TRINITY_DN67715_c3_g4_i1.p1  ORF type:complete len:128 (-),score=25.19 TRINITY_DN67715_c3_g4_i1:383-766(-)